MNLVTNWFSNNDRPKDTIGRILASAPPGTIEITQTKKPKSLLKPWVTREKELKIIFRPEDANNPASLSKCSTSTKSLPPVRSSSTATSSALIRSRSSKKPGRGSKKTVRPAMTSAPPSYDTAVALKKEEEASGGMVQAGVMSGVGMAALYCAKMAWDLYSSSLDEAEEEEEGEEDEERGRKLGWLGV